MGSHCPFPQPVEFHYDWPIKNREQQLHFGGGGRERPMKQRVAQGGGGGMGGEGPGGGELDGCIMHQVHTSKYYNKNKILAKFNEV